MTQPELIQYIVTEGCKYLGIKYPIEDYGVKNRKYIIMALRTYTLATYLEIARLLSFQGYLVVLKAHRRIEDELSDNVYGYEKTKLIYNNFLTYLKLQKNDTITT